MLKLEDMTSITEAKKNLSHYVKEAAEGDRVITILNHNRPQAVLVSAPRYEALVERVDVLREELFHARLAGRVQEGPDVLFPAAEVTGSERNLFDELGDKDLFD